MNVNGIPVVGPLAAVSATPRANVPTSRPSDANEPTQIDKNSLVQFDERTKQPIPPRFPWLSRLTRELEQAAGKTSLYDSPPPLGEHVDRKA